MGMQVPLYDRPQQQLNALPRAAAVSPQVVDTSRDTATLGKGLMDAGEGLDKIALQQANQEAFTTEAKAKEAWIGYAADLQKNRQGANAKGVAEDVNKWWAENSSKFMEGASTGRSQRMVQQSLERLRLQGLNEFQGFELKQGEIAADAAADANVKASISSIAANPSPDNMALHRAAIGAAMQQHAAARGWPPEVLSEKLATAQSAGTIAAFNTLLVRNPMDAQAFWATNRESVRGELRDEIDTRLKSAVASVEGGSLARDLFAKATAGRPYTDAIPADTLDADLVKQFGNNPESLKAARSELDRLVGLRNKVQVEQSAAATEGVMAVWNKSKSLSAVKSSTEWGQLPATQRAKIEEHIISVQTAELNRSIAAGNRDIVEMQRIEQRQRLQYAPLMVAMSQPETLSQMTRAQIVNMMPDIGAANTEHLLKTWQSYQGDQAKLSEAKVDADNFKQALTLAGIDPAPKASDKEANFKVWALRDEVERRIGVAQQGKGKPLTDAEKRIEMQRVIGEKVLTPSWWGLSSTENVAASLKPEELQKASVAIPMADGSTKNLKLSTIPANEYADTERFLRERKRPSDPASIAKYWLLGKQKK